MARLVGSWSKDPSTQVGCVVVRDDKTVASVGFNGFARGVIDVAGRYHMRELKYDLVVHGEPNAIIAAREPLHGYTLYVTPFLPCSNCAALIIQAGIKRVVIPQPTPEDRERLERWAESMRRTCLQFDEAGVLLDQV
jgi:dCMP deaminase